MVYYKRFAKKLQQRHITRFETNYKENFHPRFETNYKENFHPRFETNYNLGLKRKWDFVSVRRQWSGEYTKEQLRSELQKFSKGGKK